MEVHLGSDHRGYDIRQQIRRYLTAQGQVCIDHGCPDQQRCDYPEYAAAVGLAVAQAADEAIGILVCGSGAGIAIAANKVPGVRCIVAWCEHIAEFGRRHNHANVLAFGADVQTWTQIERCLAAYLKAAPESGRHAERVRMIGELEQQSARMD